MIIKQIAGPEPGAHAPRVRPADRNRVLHRAGAACAADGNDLRHLFASTFYRIYKDIVRLADVLGHSSVDTTRIYLVTTGEEHMRQLERLGLVT